MVRTPEGLVAGSGFIISSDGYILTAAHVIEDAQEIRVIVEERAGYVASVASSGREADVALLKISASNLTSARLGDSDQVEYGDEILVLGYPVPEAGPGLIVTSRIVQGFRMRGDVKLIQINADINPGNSGGPMVNTEGEVIGIVSELWSRLYHPSGPPTPFGLAVAINTAKRIIPPGVLPQVLRVPQDYPTIQAAIDAAREGAIIEIAPGEYRENLTIHKSLTLRGVGEAQTRIKAQRNSEPVIHIESGSEIRVTIEGLTIAEAKGASAEAAGIKVAGKAKAIISNSQILENRDGIYILHSAQATITNSQLSENGWDGIVMSDSARATISNSQVSGNGGGITIVGSAQVSITNAQLLGNRTDGILVWGSAQATISNSQVSGNGENGIAIWYSAGARIEGSTIEGNGTDPECKSTDICNDIQVAADSQTKIIGSVIRNNTGWGVTAVLKKCGYKTDWFTGKVIFEGNNQISANGRGDVCLP